MFLYNCENALRATLVFPSHDDTWTTAPSPSYALPQAKAPPSCIVVLSKYWQERGSYNTVKAAGGCFCYYGNPKEHIHNKY